MTSIAGELVTETFGYDGGRQVTAYVPPAVPEAVVFTGDGQLTGRWGAALEAAAGPPTLIVGAHRLDDEMERLHEYSPGFDPDRFAAHEEFFAGQVRRWAGSRFGVALPASRTAVFGVSAGGELALAVGLRHPDVYGAILCASPGAGYRPPAALPGPLPRAYLTAGTQEPFFLENAARWAEALRAAGGDVVLTERAGSHGGAFWRQEFPLMVAWTLARSDGLPERRDQGVRGVGAAADAPGPLGRVEYVHPDVVAVVTGDGEVGHDVGRGADEPLPGLDRGQADVRQLELDHDHRPVDAARVHVGRVEHVHGAADDLGEERVAGRPADLDESLSEAGQDLSLAG